MSIHASTGRHIAGATWPVASATGGGRSRWSVLVPCAWSLCAGLAVSCFGAVVLVHCAGRTGGGGGGTSCSAASTFACAVRCACSALMYLRCARSAAARLPATAAEHASWSITDCAIVSMSTSQGCRGRRPAAKVEMSGIQSGRAIACAMSFMWLTASRGVITNACVASSSGAMPMRLRLVPTNHMALACGTVRCAGMGNTKVPLHAGVQPAAVATDAETAAAVVSVPVAGEDCITAWRY